MSDTVQFTKSHLAKWHRAYGRGFIYVALAVLPILLDRLQQVETFAAISPVEWGVTAVSSAIAACNVIRCFLDKTMTQISENKTP